MGWLEMIERGQKNPERRDSRGEKFHNIEVEQAGLVEWEQGGMSGRIETRQPVILKKYVNTCLDAQERRIG